MLLAVSMLTFGAVFHACSDDDADDAALPEIAVTESLEFDCAQTQTQTLEIKLNGPFEWTVEAEDWIILDRKSGKGSATLNVTVEANTEARTGTIVVTALGSQGAADTGRCTVKQTVRTPAAETNVAPIREKILATGPTAEKTDLPDEIRALTLRGIVVSDRESGNQRPFLVNVADDTAEGGSGLALSIDEADNTFVRGDVVEVSLSDAQAQLYNGQLQLSTGNKPEVAEHIDPLKPITIAADKLKEYESQYVTIEAVQPEAGETGTWNSDSNKGNVSMETRDGKSFKIYTLQTADYAQEAIPTDKSGSVSGIASIYNTTLQLMPCTGGDIRLTEARFVVQGGKGTLADVLAADAGSSFEVEGATVVGTNEQGVLLQQDDARIYAFKGAEHALAVGDIVTVSGKTEIRNGLLQFGKGCELEKTGHEEAALPRPEVLSTADIEAYMDAPEIRYATYTGTVLVSGNYVNVEIDGTSVQGSLDYMSDRFKEQYDNHVLTITGWLFGSYKNYLYTIPVEVKDNGVYEEPVPDGAIYYSTFDKSLSSETFGDGSQWPFLDQFDGWINHKGSGADQVTYDYEHMSVRSNQSSKGSLSLYEGSGKNNIFFSTAPNHFTIAKIAVPSRDLRLTFGAQRYSQGGSNQFITSDFEVRLSADGQMWSQKLDYEFGGVADDPGQWRLATADFTLPEGTSTLYIKFTAKIGSANRIDDVLLLAGDGGQQIVFGAEDEVPLSTVDQVLAGPIDEIYKIEGQVIGTHSKGFLVRDDTGTILVFKKNHGTSVGDRVSVEGATTEYGGMKQFGESSEITVLGKGSFTQPEPEVFEAEQFDAYVLAPDIRYIEYVGTLTTYRDQHYQYHYNVAVDGTSVVGSVVYPNSSLNISSFEKREVRVRGYAVGVSGSDVKYLNTMAISIENTQQEVMPDESEALTVKELNARLAALEPGAPLSDLVAVKGYIAANNEGGNLYQILSLVDNTGEPGSGIILKGMDYTDATLPVGSEVIVSLKYAEYDLYQGLPQVKRATVFATGDKAEMKVPVIDDTQAGDYLGQYVTVKSLTPDKSATTWVVGGKTTTTNFTGANGITIAARVTNYAVFKDRTIAQKTADLSGVMEIYRGTYQIYPVSLADVAGFE